MKSSQKRVLIVDDEWRICALLAKLLEQEGLQIETAFDGAKAVELARERKFSLVLMDLRMFHLGGEEAISTIEELNPGAKFLIVTGYVLNPALEKKIRAGVYEYMAKPFDNQQLTQKVRQMLTGRTYDKRKTK